MRTHRHHSVESAHSRLDPSVIEYYWNLLPEDMKNNAEGTCLANTDQETSTIKNCDCDGIMIVVVDV